MRSSLSQFRTENRYALFLELHSSSLSQFRAENRYALFLELLRARTAVRRRSREKNQRFVASVATR